MIRSMTLAAMLAAGLSAPALAADPATGSSADSASVSQYLAELGKAANANEVRKLLQAKGYTNVSNLSQDESGRWLGTAEKDGKLVNVGVSIPPRSDSAPTTN